MTQRTDEHRPSAIRPEDYEWRHSYDSQPPTFMPFGGDSPEAMRIAQAEYRMVLERWWAQYEEHVLEPLQASPATVYGSPNKCDHCGANLRYGNLYHHAPSGGVIVVGDICAEETMEVPDRARLEQKRLRERAQAARMREAEGKQAREARAKAEAAYPQAAGILNAALAQLAAHEAACREAAAGWEPEAPELHPAIADIAERFGRFGKLSEKQAAFVCRLDAEARERERQALVDAELRAKGELQAVPNGKQQVVGTVVKAYTKETAYGSRFVMVVQDDRGFRLWGTVPTSISTVELAQGQRSLGSGDRVSFSASLERSDRDEGFGFYKRPTKAQVLQS